MALMAGLFAVASNLQRDKNVTKWDVLCRPGLTITVRFVEPGR